MAINRRNFITASIFGGIGASIPLTSFAKTNDFNVKERYAKLDEVLNMQVLKKELFPNPVIIERLELLRYADNFLCRVISKDGAVGISASNNSQMISFFPVFETRLKPYFIHHDAREIEALINEAYVSKGNYKFQSLALWVPIATIEFAILDMLGRIANKPVGELIGHIHHQEITFYQANSERENSEEELVENIKKQLSTSNAKALKFKVGGRMSHPENPPGRSERMIPLARKVFGDEMHLFADANGSYDTKEAVRIGKLLEEYKFEHYEEPVPFDWYEETKEVADALMVPIAGGEQESSLHAFRWLIANDALQIVQPDIYYFGGMIRSMKVARMAEIFGKEITPHLSSGLGYLYLMHFLSAVPNIGRFHEFKGANNKIPLECTTSSLDINNGVIQIPTGPGIGIDIDPEFIKKHTVVKD